MYLTVLILGILQGITEFLPISSSAHLLLLGQVSGLDNSFELAVLLNIGTLAALIYHYRFDLKHIGRQIAGNDWRIFFKLLVSVVPIALVGFFATDFFKSLSDNILVMSAMLVGVGILMFLPIPRVRVKKFKAITWSQTLAVAGLQTLALVPGTSRSGITILSGLWLGFKKDLAVTWSFLLAIPLVAGAVVRVALTPDGFQFVIDHPWEVFLGNLAAFVVGLLALRFLVSLLKKYSLKPFGYYRIILSLILLSVWIIRL